LDIIINFGLRFGLGFASIEFLGILFGGDFSEEFLITEVKSESILYDSKVDSVETNLIVHVSSTDVSGTLKHGVADLSEYISLGESADSKATTDRSE
jgi:hypothetical protein